MRAMETTTEFVMLCQICMVKIYKMSICQNLALLGPNQSENEPKANFGKFLG